MSADAPTAEAVRSDLASLAAPLREHLSTLDAAISTKERELAELRGLRAEVKRALTTVDPTFTPAQQNGKKPGYAADPNPVKNPAKLAIFRSFLEEHRDDFEDGDVMASRIIKLANGTTIGLGAKYYTAALAELRDQGVLRADRKVKGGGVVYKFVG